MDGRGGAAHTAGLYLGIGVTAHLHPFFLMILPRVISALRERRETLMTEEGKDDRRKKREE